MPEATVVSLFPEDFDVPLTDMLPVADLLPYLERAIASYARLHSSSAGGRRQLARVLTDRMGRRSENGLLRLLDRLVNGHQKHISERLADELACALGLHPVLIWPEDWCRARDCVEVAG